MRAAVTFIFLKNLTYEQRNRSERKRKGCQIVAARWEVEQPCLSFSNFLIFCTLMGEKALLVFCPALPPLLHSTFTPFSAPPECGEGDVLGASPGTKKHRQPPYSGWGEFLKRDAGWKYGSRNCSIGSGSFRIQFNPALLLGESEMNEREGGRRGEAEVERERNKNKVKCFN